jgi:cysteine desulfurase/selenocysteine lyase
VGGTNGILHYVKTTDSEEFIIGTENGMLQDQYYKIEGATLVTCSLISTVFGSVLPVNQIGKVARKATALFCVDAAQAVGHMSVDVTKLNGDFLVFSGHKGPMGPTGVGVLYIKKEVQSGVPCIFGRWDDYHCISIWI